MAKLKKTLLTSSDLTPLDESSRVTGRHIKHLQNRYDTLYMQHYLGMPHVKIQKKLKPEVIDQPEDNTTLCYIIRTLFAAPELIPVYKLANFDSFIRTIKTLPDSFPLPNDESSAAVWFGRSYSSSYSLRNGRSLIRVLKIWFSMIINHIDDIQKFGKAHPIVQAITTEAKVRGFNLHTLLENQGWPKEHIDPNTHIEDIPNYSERITGHHLLELSKRFDSIDFQNAIGMDRAKISILTNKQNISKPLNDVALCSVVRVLLESTDFAAVVKLNSLEDLINKIDSLPPNDVFPRLIPKTLSGYGSLIGRGATSVHGLIHGKRESHSIALWVTTLLNNMDEILVEKERHPLLQVMIDEAKSRNVPFVYGSSISENFALLTAGLNILEEWGASKEMQSAITGISLATLNQYRQQDENDSIRLLSEQCARLYSVLRTHLYLNILFDKTNTSKNFFSLRNNNAPFCGKTPFDYVGTGDIRRLYAVENFVSSMSLGVRN